MPSELFINFLLTSILVGFILTTLGGVPILFIRGAIHSRLFDLLNGYAAGIMLAASIFSLLLPGLEFGSLDQVLLGYIAGVFFILLLKDRIHIFYYKIRDVEESDELFLKALVVFIALTLHNFPEGMSVGVAFASGSILLGLRVGLAIGIQNIPEGFAVAAPLVKSGVRARKAFMYSAISGIVEPINALFGFFLVTYVHSLLPYMFGFCSGAMMFVVFNEMFPEAQHDEYLDKSSLSIILGFLTMFTLDIALG